jgi:anaerobic nitric oxide reductase flavorubredoxin
MNAVRLADGIYRLGANISKDDLFEGMWPIPDGVSLNSYIVRGEKTVLIDLVRDWQQAPEKIRAQLESIGFSFETLDYLVLNHLEPDHTGWLSYLRELNPGLQIVTTEKGVPLVKTLYRITENVRAVKSGDTLELGGDRRLVFEEVPNVHWPETMVSYEPGSGILFSCDAFGSYGAVGDKVFDDELSEVEHAFYERESLRYYANIVASFSVFVQRAVKKLEGLEVKMICPSHGIIWRAHPERIVERYVKFASYLSGPAEPEVTVIWGSMYGNTAAALQKVVEGIEAEGVPVTVHRVPDEDVSHVLASAWKSAGIVLGMPTYEYRMFPPMANVLDMFDRKHVYGRKAFRFGSFGWSGGAQKELDGFAEKLKWSFLPPVEWQGAPTEEHLAAAYGRGRELAVAVKSGS